MNQLKTFHSKAEKDDLIIQCRKMSGLQAKRDWREVTHIEVQVYHRARFKALAARMGLKTWELPDHWFGVSEPHPVAVLRMVVNTLYDHTQNWSYGAVGMQVAYLTLAILNHSRFETAEDVPWSAAFRETLERLFPPHHPVWPFISLSKPSDT